MRAVRSPTLRPLRACTRAHTTCSCSPSCLRVSPVHASRPRASLDVSSGCTGASQRASSLGMARVAEVPWECCVRARQPDLRSPRPMSLKQLIQDTAFYRGEQVLYDGRPAVAVCKAASQSGSHLCVSIVQAGVRRDVSAHSLARPTAPSYVPGDYVLWATASGVEEQAMVRLARCS